MPSSTEPRPRRTPHSDGTGRAGLDTGNELCQLNEITAVQRQIDDLAGIDDGSDGGIFGFQQRTGRGNRRARFATPGV
jgi:hypothetical protein